MHPTWIRPAAESYESLVKRKLPFDSLTPKLVKESLLLDYIDFYGNKIDFEFYEKGEYIISYPSHLKQEIHILTLN